MNLMNWRSRSAAFFLASLLLSGCGVIALAQPTPTATQPPPTMTATVTSTVTATVVVDTGWQGEYFNNDKYEGNPVLTRVDPELNFNWRDEIPVPGLSNDLFTVRWIRCLHLKEGSYTFTAAADDSARIYVDDTLVLETPLPPVSLDISEGEHCIKVEYREFIGPAYINFSIE
jgi:alpha-L-fucosidase